MKRLALVLCLLAFPALADGLDYKPFVAAWPSLPGATAAEKIAAYDSAMVVDPAHHQDVPVGSVEGYLRLTGTVTKMEDWLATNPAASAAKTAARELLGVLSSYHVTVFQTSDPAKYAQLQAMLTALSADPPALLTKAQVTDLLAMAAVTIPRWQADGYPYPLNNIDVQLAGLH